MHLQGEYDKKRILLQLQPTDPFTKKISKKSTFSISQCNMISTRNWVTIFLVLQKVKLGVIELVGCAGLECNPMVILMNATNKAVRSLSLIGGKFMLHIHTHASILVIRY